MDGRCADRHQHREVVDVERVAGLDDDVGARAPAGRHQLLVHAADGEDRRDRNAARAGGTIGHHDELHATSRRRARLPAEPRHPEREPARPARGRPGGIEDGHAAQRSRAAVAHRSWSRIGESMTTAAGSGVAQVVRLPPDGHGERHDRALALRIDRRVRDLRERLAQEGARHAAAGARAARSACRRPCSRSPRAPRSPSGGSAASRSRRRGRAQPRSRSSLVGGSPTGIAA